MSSVPRLPPEVWESIFKAIDDPIVLVELQFVCKDWQQLAKPILLNHTNWKKACENHVPYFWVIASLHRLYDNIFEDVFRTKVTQDCWRYIYMSYRRWQRQIQLQPDRCSITTPRQTRLRLRQIQLSGLAVKSSSILKLSESEKISCLDACGDIVAFGSTKGAIYFCYIRELNKPFFTGHQKQPVTEVRLDTEYDLILRHPLNLAVSTCDEGHLTYWNYQKREEVALENKYLGRFLNAPSWLGVTFVSLWEHTLSLYCAVFRLTQNPWKLVLPLTTSEKVVAVYSSGTKISILTFDGTCTRMGDLDYSSLGSDPLLLFKYCNEESSLLPNDLESSDVKKFDFINAEVAVCSTDHFLAFSALNEPWIVHNMDQLGGKIKSLFYFLNEALLIIGMESGAIHLFEVDAADWKNIDLASSVETLMVDSKPIISLKVADINIGDSGQQYHILAATEHKVHSVKSKVLDNKAEMKRE